MELRGPLEASGMELRGPLEASGMELRGPLEASGMELLVVVGSSKSLPSTYRCSTSKGKYVPSLPPHHCSQESCKSWALAHLPYTMSMQHDRVHLAV